MQYLLLANALIRFGRHAGLFLKRPNEVVKILKAGQVAHFRDVVPHASQVFLRQSQSLLQNVVTRCDTKLFLELSKETGAAHAHLLVQPVQINLFADIGFNVLNEVSEAVAGSHPHIVQFEQLPCLRLHETDHQFAQGQVCQQVFLLPVLLHTDPHQAIDRVAKLLGIVQVKHGFLNFPLLVRFHLGKLLIQQVECLLNVLGRYGQRDTLGRIGRGRCR